MEEFDLLAGGEDSEEEAQWIAATLAPLLETDSGVYEKKPESGRSGLVFWVLRDPSQAEGFRMMPRTSMDDLSASALGFAPAPERPARYPADLPFVEDCPAIFNPADSALRLHWFEIPDGLAAFRSIVAQCVESGWTCRESEPITLPIRSPAYVEMQRGLRTRVATLRLHGGVVGAVDLIETAT